MDTISRPATPTGVGSVIPIEDQGVAYDRFARALRQAMVVHGFSERRLANALGITIGTTQKYFRSKVHPMRVSTEVSHRLAGLLGVTLDSLVAFYETGQYESGLGFPEVVSWVRSSAGLEHLTPILEAISQAGKRAIDIKQATEEARAKPEPYTWPLEELESAGVSMTLRERMGLTEEAMAALVNEGVFDDELVEAFSVATNLEEAEVRKAFTRRQPIPCDEE